MSAFSYITKREKLPEDIKLKLLNDIDSKLSVALPSIIVIIFSIIIVATILLALFSFGFSEIYLILFFVISIVFFKAVSKYKRVKKDTVLALKQEQIGYLNSELADYHKITFDRHYMLIPHEHGVMIIIPASINSVFYYDVSSVADDPLDPIMNNIIESNTLPTIWEWWTIDGIPYTLGFRMHGGSINPKLLKEFEDPDKFGDFYNFISEEVQENGYILNKKYEDILSYYKSLIKN